MHFRQISAKIQPKNVKQHFDWGEPGTLGPPGYALEVYRYPNFVLSMIYFLSLAFRPPNREAFSETAKLTFNLKQKSK